MSIAEFTYLFEEIQDHPDHFIDKPVLRAVTVWIVIPSTTESNRILNLTYKLPLIWALYLENYALEYIDTGRDRDTIDKHSSL